MNGFGRVPLIASLAHRPGCLFRPQSPMNESFNVSGKSGLWRFVLDPTTQILELACLHG